MSGRGVAGANRAGANRAGANRAGANRAGANGMFPFRAMVLLLATLGHGFGQQTAANTNPQEMAAQDAPVTFQSGINLVLVPVVVRDKDSHAVGTLKKEDFQLFDNGKPQTISKFSVEKSSGMAATAVQARGASAPDEAKPPDEASPTIPGQFIAYLFDDVHLDFGDLAQARSAAEKVIFTALNPATRIAIFTTSGLHMQDFTDDEVKLRQALKLLQPRSKAPLQSECPYVSYYIADAIVNRNDSSVLGAITAEVMACESLPPQSMQMAQSEAQAEARRALTIGDLESRTSLGVLKDAVRRLAGLPGQRSLVLVSPGFITPQVHQDVTDIIDRAIRLNVTISSLDTRGLYMPGTIGDASRAVHSLQAEQVKSRYDREEARLQEDMLGELADGTGGTFFHDNNDLAVGFKRLGTPPEYVYLLGFSAGKLKPDGKFHKLKVTVDQKGLSLQARRGYYSPKHEEDPVEDAKQAIEEAVFSRDETSDFPISMKTQFFKTDEDDAKLTVVTHVDLKPLRFHKEDGRNRDDLTLISALFDRNGNYIVGKQTTLAMRLKEENLGNKLASGVTVKFNFDVKIGDYLLRLVVRDSGGQMMSTANSAVEIP